MEFNDRATHGASITDLYILAPKLNKVRHCSDPKILEARLQESPTAFTVLRGSFTAVLTAYHPPNRYNAVDVMHAVFFTPRGSKTALHPDKIEAAHEMLLLKPGEALLNHAHPVCRDWEPELNGGIRRIFAAGRSLVLQRRRTHTCLEETCHRLFAALYDLIFGKLTKMGHVIPSRNRKLVQIFTEKVPGTDLHLISPKLIAYLKWLIYVSAYEDRSTVAHVEFYQKQVLFYRNPAKYKMWRSLLYKEWEE